MHKMRTFLLVAILVISAAGCGDQTKNVANKLEGQNFSGVIPCADCSGIAYQLSLVGHRRYQSSMMYLGRSNRSFVKHGQWKLKNDSLLILSKNNGHQQSFAVRDSGLVMLGQDGNFIEGPLASHYVLSRAPLSRSNKHWKKLKNTGIDFRAAGNEPSWSLKIDFDNMISFQPSNNDSLMVPVPKMKNDSSSQARTFHASTEQGSLMVKLYPTGCMDQMSGDVFGYAVTINAGKKSYHGCGNYLNNHAKLNDFWSLQTMDGTSINDLATDRRPSLQIDLANAKVHGSTGCNRLNGSLSVQDSSLSFSKMATTKMVCGEHSMKMESKFLSALQNTHSYNLKNGQLALISSNDTLMIFERSK